MHPVSFFQQYGIRLLILLGYAAAFSLLLGLSVHFLWFAVGVLSGAVFLIADEQYLYRWYQENTQEQKAPFFASRSPLFLLALVPLSIMVVTSFGSFWASGMIGGITLFLLVEMTELRRQPAVFDRRFLTGVKSQATEQTVRTILLIGWILFAVIQLLAVL